VQKIVKYIVALVILVAVLGFMVTYTVRFTEMAVVTTFGKADETSIKRDPGLGFRLPYPIQSVVKYDNRIRIVETRLESIQTADNRLVAVQSFLTWRIEDPLKFYKLYGGTGQREIEHFRQASDTLSGKLRSAMSAVSEYRMDQILSPSADGSRLAELETKVLEALRGGNAAGVGSSLADGGVEPLSVGISKISLPDAITRNVFERMKATRETLASEAQSKGDSLAQTIRQQAENDAKMIMAFAEARAQQIRAQGDQEAAAFYARQTEDVDLAVFLKNLDFLRSFVSKRTTLIVPLSAPGMWVFRSDAMDNKTQGKLPGLTDDRRTPDQKQSQSAPSAPATAPASAPR
jgi:membrane protease subunit HflC